MKTFVSGIILTKEEAKEFEYTDIDYDMVASGDYIVHALFEVTNEGSSLTIYNDDNCHSSIVSDIESFIEGFSWSHQPAKHIQHCVFVTDKDPYSAYYKELTLLYDGETIIM